MSSIRTKPATDAYREHFDETFRRHWPPNPYLTKRYKEAQDKLNKITSDLLAGIKVTYRGKK